MDIEWIRGSADVALLVPVGTSYPVDVCQQHVVADIKLSIFVKERSIDVHLHDKGVLLFLQSRLTGLFFLVAWFSFHEIIQFVDLVDDSDSSALVGVFTRLNNPNIP